jgi:hypothetical protein
MIVDRYEVKIITTGAEFKPERNRMIEHNR